MKTFALLISSILFFPLISLAAITSAFYDVPVKDESLLAAARNPLPVVSFKNDNGNVTLSYDLPLEITGPEARHFELTGNATANGIFTIVSAGLKDAGRCTLTEVSLNCKVIYSNLELDPEAGQKLLMAQFADNPELLAEKLEVFNIFAADPVGIVDLTLGPDGL